MQPRLASLPELPGVGHQPVATPVLRTRRVQPEPGRHLGDVLHQDAPIGDHLGLRRRPCPDPGIERPHREVGVRLGRVDLLDTPLNAHHPLQLDPVELQRRARVVCEFVRLAGLVVGVPDDAPLVDVLDQHHPGGRPTVSTDGRQRHRVRLRDLRVLGLGEPLLELRQRRCRGVGFVKFAALVALAKCMQASHGHQP